MRALALLLLAPALLSAHDPVTTKLTWTKEISRLVLKRCAGCHRPGAQAPFSLLTYEDARPWAVAIREEAALRTMPPWGAVKGFGHFKDDPSLSQEELTLLIEWVNGGAPEGEPQYAPKESPAPFAYAATKKPGRLIAKDTRLAAPLTLNALRPQRLAPNTPLQVIAELPDGTREPLLWIRQWKSTYRHAFVLAEPMKLPAGSTIRTTGPVLLY